MLFLRIHAVSGKKIDDDLDQIGSFFSRLFVPYFRNQIYMD